MILFGLPHVSFWNVNIPSYVCWCINWENIHAQNIGNMNVTILLTPGDTYLHYRSIILIFIPLRLLLQNWCFTSTLDSQIETFPKMKNKWMKILITLTLITTHTLHSFFHSWKRRSNSLQIYLPWNCSKAMEFSKN